MLFELVVWWYGSGWVGAWKDCFSWVKKVQRFFSIDVLLGSLFAPWKRIVSIPGRSLDEKFRAAIDNLVSRVIGFCVRFLVLIVAVIMVTVAGVAGIVMAIIWPLVPFLAIALIVVGFMG
ncbi:hypothetical protein A2884_00995 [Candidatus Saccharibacteria bacterium RIFCSPHIGHO2_01_FULL_48_12]|nr:MAG: hypothetical protein A2884_00995 [Candidatus Saccharibacteria bacterium RIFCSPHIGHO2_01_FULL_48_12]OGL36265.1 MAG: hypothetical protein A3F38_01230 [Candidatus Saccharibacteria bacterium RIFCSPHIGHO2_12_FULL_48_21]